MGRLTSIFAFSALTLSLSGHAFAADEGLQGQPAAPTVQDEGSPPAAELSKDEQEYLASLKKCEGLHDEEKQKCVEDLKQKYHRM